MRGEAKVQELGADAKGPGGVRTAAPEPPGSPRAVPHTSFRLLRSPLTLIDSKLSFGELPPCGTDPSNAREQF